MRPQDVAKIETPTRASKTHESALPKICESGSSSKASSITTSSAEPSSSSPPECPKKKVETNSRSFAVCERQKRIGMHFFRFSELREMVSSKFLSKPRKIVSLYYLGSQSERERDAEDPSLEKRERERAVSLFFTFERRRCEKFELTASTRWRMELRKSASKGYLPPTYRPRFVCETRDSISFPQSPIRTMKSVMKRRKETATFTLFERSRSSKALYQYKTHSQSWKGIPIRWEHAEGRLVVLRVRDVRDDRRLFQVAQRPVAIA